MSSREEFYKLLGFTHEYVSGNGIDEYLWHSPVDGWAYWALPELSQAEINELKLARLEKLVRKIMDESHGGCGDECLWCAEVNELGSEALKIIKAGA
jgi:hypothetical protein